LYVVDPDKVISVQHILSNALILVQIISIMSIWIVKMHLILTKN